MKRLRISIPAALAIGIGAARSDDLPARFATPPDSARPGVYWYFMDGNLSRDGMTRDLESMKAAGIGNLIFLEVNVGVPRGPVNFLGEEWQNLYAHAVREAERLGIEITLGSGPGWTGSGGPWVKPEQSMLHLVASRADVEGPAPFTAKLAAAPPRRPFFGHMPDSMRAAWESYFKDVAVLAFPTPAAADTIPDIDEKAIYYRAPISSQPGVRPYFVAQADYPAAAAGSAIAPESIVDLTGRLNPDGSLDWQVPAGRWTVMRFVSRNNGASTRPAPQPGLGFECDKFDPAALDAHYGEYVGKLLKKVGPRRTEGGGWTMLHIDSWEMGAQNWTPRLREEFRKRRGYDPLPFYPAYLGLVVGDRERTERFLWDLRWTGHELIVEYHAEHLKRLGRKDGFGLSIEPYDMHPGCDFDMGSVADVPMCEFWSVGFDTAFSCIQASSIAHVMGRPVVAAEAFTGAPGENWKLYPGALKNQGDWAFAAGINRFVYHTFAHKPDEGRPGMVMGPYGVHWDRGQTWWPMAGAYHRYVTRCQHLLRQGRTVADLLYLLPEGAPNVFKPPESAFEGSARMPDRRAYNFDGCSPQALIRMASVRDGRIEFTGGASYRLLVLPDVPTMTPELLEKLDDLIRAGAVVVGSAPRKSPSLAGFPACDRAVSEKAARIWGGLEPPAAETTVRRGKGRVVWGGSWKGGAASSSSAIMDANWIWYPAGEPAQSYPVGSVHFRRDVELEAARMPVSATLEMTADNSFAVTLNGKAVGEGDNFHNVVTFDVTRRLKGGLNRIEVRADNGGDAPNPAGLLACLRMTFADGTTRVVVSDGDWTASPDAAFAAGSKPAKVLGAAGMAPWSLKPPAAKVELYPAYERAAVLLGSMGIAPDFVSDGPVRYTHRTLKDRELYFVANRSDKPVRVTAAFRVAGRAPELWDPVSGSIRPLPEFSDNGAATSIPLRFEPYESYFVVFPEAPARATAGRAASNFTDCRTVSTLEGAWDVSFDTTLGGPARVRFEKLDDWTARPEEGVRYYSGLAVYRRSFDLPAAGLPTSGLHLDLGTVHAMARVRVNGTDCGVAWTAPWRVDISKAAKGGSNELEIEVANLWPNRMIGDAKTPDRAFAKTTYKPFKAGDPLLPSGLIGPVRVLSAKP